MKLTLPFPTERKHLLARPEQRAAERQAYDQ
jgi:hypothetical protein